MHVRFLTWIGLTAATCVLPAAEPQWFVHVNGTSRHFHRRDLNEENWGVGASYVFNPGDRWLWSAEADYFQDSFDDPSGYLGAAYRRRFRYADLGLVGFVMYRETADENIGTKVFPGVLPFVELGTERVRARLAYIPPVTGKDDEAITLQLLLGF